MPEKVFYINILCRKQPVQAEIKVAIHVINQSRANQQLFLSLFNFGYISKEISVKHVLIWITRTKIAEKLLAKREINEFEAQETINSQHRRILLQSNSNNVISKF